MLPAPDIRQVRVLDEEIAIADKRLERHRQSADRGHDRFANATVESDIGTIAEQATVSIRSEGDVGAQPDAISKMGCVG